MGPAPRSRQASARPSFVLRAGARRADKLSRDRLPDDSPLLPGLVFRLGPIGMDGGDPASALARAVGDAEQKSPR
jgi:hypothetical protein